MQVHIQYTPKLWLPVWWHSSMMSNEISSMDISFFLIALIRTCAVQITTSDLLKTSLNCPKNWNDISYDASPSLDTRKLKTKSNRKCSQQLTRLLTLANPRRAVLVGRKCLLKDLLLLLDQHPYRHDEHPCWIATSIWRIFIEYR